MLTIRAKSEDQGGVMVVDCMDRCDVLHSQSVRGGQVCVRKAPGTHSACDGINSAVMVHNLNINYGPLLL